MEICEYYQTADTVCSTGKRLEGAFEHRDGKKTIRKTGKESGECLCYMSSLKEDLELFSCMFREHWGGKYALAPKCHI